MTYKFPRVLEAEREAREREPLTVACLKCKWRYHGPGLEALDQQKAHFKANHPFKRKARKAPPKNWYQLMERNHGPTA